MQSLDVRCLVPNDVPNLCPRAHTCHIGTDPVDQTGLLASRLKGVKPRPARAERSALLSRAAPCGATETTESPQEAVP